MCATVFEVLLARVLYIEAKKKVCFVSFSFTHTLFGVKKKRKMACATLKRSLDWETINQRPAKRRRCSPFTGSPSQNQAASSSSSKVTVTEPTVSAFSDKTYPKLTPGKF